MDYYLDMKISKDAKTTKSIDESPDEHRDKSSQQNTCQPNSRTHQKSLMNK